MARAAFMGWECDTVLLEYANSGTAIRLVDIADGSPVATATSWIPGLAADEVAIKSHAENEGMLAALLDAGVVEPPHRTARANGLGFPVCRLAGPMV